MRTTLLLLAAVWLAPGLKAQEPTDTTGGRKKVTIVRTWTDDQGRVHKETIIKEGNPDPNDEGWFASDRSEAPEDAVLSREVEISVMEDSGTSGSPRRAPWESLSEDIRRGIPDVERYLRDAGVELQEISRDLDRSLSGPAFLGVVTEPHPQGAHITEVVDDSPAARAGLQPGDILTHLGDQAVRNQQDLVRALRRYKAGDMAGIQWLRDGEALSAETVLDQRGGGGMRRSSPPAREERILLYQAPRVRADRSAWLGVRMEDHRDGIRVSQVMRNSPARAVGLAPGDILYRIDRRSLGNPDELITYLRDKKEGDRVVLYLRREGKKLEVPVILGDRTGCCLPSDCPPGCCENEGMSSEEIRIQDTGSPIPAGPGDLALPDLRIYPNPTGGLVRIAFRTPSEEGFTLRVLDPQGVAVQIRELQGINRFDEELDLRDYPSGNYTLIIEQDGRFLSRTIIRTR